MYYHVLAYCCEHAAIDFDIDAAVLNYDPLDILRSAHGSEYYYKHRVTFNYFALVRTLRSWRSSPGFLAYILGHPPSDAEISQFGMTVCSSNPNIPDLKISKGVA